MTKGELSRQYASREVIPRQGEPGDCLYVIQQRQVEVVREQEKREVRLSVLGESDFFGQVPPFERQRRSATVRAVGDVHVPTVDRKTLLLLLLLLLLEEDPTLAYRILEILSRPAHELDAEMARLITDG